MRPFRPSSVAFVAGITFFAFSAENTRADLIINIKEVGSNVVASGGGSVLEAGLSLVGGQANAVPIAKGNRILVGDTVAGPIKNYGGLVGGPANWGSGALTKNATSGFGDLFGVIGSGPGGTLSIPDGYVWGDSLNASSTFAGESFSSIGIDPGTYQWTFGDGSITQKFILKIGDSSIPEPSTFGVIGIVLLLAGWRRKKNELLP